MTSLVCSDPSKMVRSDPPSLNLSFVKDIDTVGKKMTRNGCKMAIYQMQILMINL